MNYSELEKELRKWIKEHPRKSLTAHIVFTEDSCPERTSRLSRSYRIGIDKKAYWLGMSGRSIFACCLDGTGQRVKLDWNMFEEGNQDGWKVEDCYILEQMRDAVVIPRFERTVQGDGTVCYFFGDTCIRVREGRENGTLHLEPLGGDQAACGEWADLSIDRVYGYCTLLEQHLNAKLHTTRARDARK